MSRKMLRAAFGPADYTAAQDAPCDMKYPPCQLDWRTWL
ncbi:hypothetical protein Mycch_5367 (plasmid) [Mycolicibacterium chubuense NBB4]|uniref:Uncharacterized protein n=1 Tax=Mycolicibacterium chubuense (strain NBB4) TaxID=710421 RepID=I4BRY7_MYCCN|nr:hypothetical protein Mycch_5367 [Mycolicibacterium chubuense NBB4]